MHSCRALIRKWGNKGEAGIPGIHFTGVAYSRRYGSGLTGSVLVVAGVAVILAAQFGSAWHINA